MSKDASYAKSVERKCLGSLILVSVAELLNFSAFISLEGLQSNLNKEVGMIALGLLYLTFLLTSMFLPPLVMNKLSCKKILCISTLAYATYTAANFYPVAYTMIPAAMLLGMGASLLWSTVRVYVTRVATWHATARTKSVEKTTYLFFGVFFTIFSFAVVIGNLVISFLASMTSTSDVTTNVTSQYNSTQAECGLFYKMGETPQNSTQEGNSLPREKVNMGLMVFLAMQLVGALLCLFLYETEPDFRGNEQVELVEGKSPEEKKEESTLGLLKLMFRILRRDKPALLLMPITMRGGFLWAFVMGQFTSAWISCAIGITHVTNCMAVLGATMAMSSFSSAYLAKKIPVSVLILVTSLLETCILITLIAWQPTDVIWVYYVIAGGFGVTNGIMKSQVPAVYSLIWTSGDDLAGSSALQSLWESGASTVLYGLSGVMYPVTQLVFVMATTTVGTATLLVAWRIRDKASRFW